MLHLLFFVTKEEKFIRANKSTIKMIACFKALCFVCEGVSEGVVYIALDDCIYMLYYFFCIEGLMSNVLLCKRPCIHSHRFYEKTVMCVIFSQAKLLLTFKVSYVDKNHRMLACLKHFLFLRRKKANNAAFSSYSL